MPLGKSKDAKTTAEYKKHENIIMENARKKAEEKENAKWDAIAEDLYVGGSEEDNYIDWVLSLLRESGYELPKRKL